MRNFRLHHFGSILVVLALFAVGQVALNWYGKADAQLSTSDMHCSTGTYIYIDNMTSSTTNTLSPGVHNVSLSVEPNTASFVKSVTFTLDTDTTILGRAQQLGTNPYWEMQWMTQLTTPGTHMVGAIMTLDSGKCQIPSVPVVVSPSDVQGKIAVQSTPGRFEGYTNEPRNFSLSSVASDTNMTLDITPWTNFRVVPVSLGVVTPADGSNHFRFSAGPAAGQSTINVLAQYAGTSRLLEIPVKVLAQQAAISPNLTTSTATPPKHRNPASTARNDAAARTTTLDADTAVKQCVVAKIGEARYAPITEGKERPSHTDFEAFRLCFASRNYVIPGGWVPVEAKKEAVIEQPVSSDIKVAVAKTVAKEVHKTKKNVIKFAGKGKPLTTVLIYIFSEPLVVSTSTDANGDWSYTLEDPLEPGKHEAYALVNKGDGNYERSSVFSFAVAKVEAAAANPNGLSLNLESNQPTATPDTSPVRLYVAGVLTLIIIGAGIVWMLMHRRRAKLTPSFITPERPVSTTDNDFTEPGDNNNTPDRSA